MTYEYSSDTGSRTEVVGEQTLYGEPRHEAGDHDDEQTLYGDPQHDSADGIDAWDVELLFAHIESGPTRPDELGSRTNPSAAGSAER